MFKNYLKSAIRNLAKHKLYTAINIFSLAIGLALCVITISHLAYEFSFEDFHKNRDRTYRVRTVHSSEDTERWSARVMAPLGPALVEELPEVEKAAVFRRFASARFKIDNTSYTAGNVNFANPDFLTVFDFPLKAGNIKTALSEPLSVIISDSIAQAHFAGVSPIGQSITINDRFDCQVTGVFEPIPTNTQLRCDFLVSHKSLDPHEDMTESWEHIESDYVFLMLKPDADYLRVETKIPDVLNKYLTPDQAKQYRMNLQPFGDIYFGAYYDGYRSDLYPAGEYEMVYLFIAIAIFILVQAIANFINLSTARATYRIKEVGVRKTVGAFRRDLIGQFLGESILVSFFALLLSLPLYELAKPWFNYIWKRPALADIYSNFPVVVALIALILVVGILAGFYPALYLSRFKPITILHGKVSMKSSRSLLRKGLVTFQFIIAIFFISSSVIINRQLDYVTGVDLGFDRSNLLILDFDGEQAADNCQRMKNALQGESYVRSVTASNCPLGRMEYVAWGMYKDEQRRDEDYILVKAFFADREYVSTFGLNLIEGTDLTDEVPGEIRTPILISKSSVEELGWENPIGSRLYRKGENFYEVVGVLEDFRSSTSVIAECEISFVALDDSRSTTLAIKLSSDDYEQALAGIGEIWNTVAPGEIFKYTFLEDEIELAYADYWQQGAFFYILALLAIAIACTGIFGLVSYTAEQKTKEIGIRKILGAWVPDVVGLLGKEFVILIVIANVIAFPLAYLFMKDFLASFIYQAGFGIGTFAFIGLLALMLAMASVGFQAFRAAVANPVDSLRHE
ncbi:MAG: ABC transporter permease [Candidatus Zixiibacteriota bacterium]|nr:MAG: ABC transporter permease [candidate division Zixibacteria bacterium]